MKPFILYEFNSAKVLTKKEVSLKFYIFEQKSFGRNLMKQLPNYTEFQAHFLYVCNKFADPHPQIYLFSLSCQTVFRST